MIHKKFDITTPGPARRNLLFIALGIGLLLLLALFAADDSADAPETAATGRGDEPTAWVCPMNDVPPLPASGDCPVCGMELVPMGGDNAGSGGRSRLTLTEQELEVAGVTLVPAERKFVTAEIRMFGNIEYDPGYYSQIDAFTSGIIDKVYVRRLGEFIRPNQKLFEFYSAEIYDMELELLELSKQIPNFVTGQLGQVQDPSQRGWVGRQGRTRERGSSRPSYQTPQRSAPATTAGDNLDFKKAKDLQRRFSILRFRLRSFGLYDQDINQILRLERPVGIIPVRIPTLTSTVGGIVIENNAQQGRYVNTGEPLMTIADPHFVWAKLQAFEADYQWLRIGQEVEFTTEARPGEVYHGQITEIDPLFDPKTRTFDVGLVYTDEANRLRPNMLVQAVVKARLTADGRPVSDTDEIDKAPLVIPDTAPLLTGKRAVVYVADPERPGTFEGREIVLGLRAGDHYIVHKGLEPGELVAASGNFKIDSELQIRARPSMMNPEGLEMRTSPGTAPMVHERDAGMHPTTSHVPNPQFDMRTKPDSEVQEDAAVQGEELEDSQDVPATEGASGAPVRPASPEAPEIPGMSSEEAEELTDEELFQRLFPDVEPGAASPATPGKAQ